MEKTNKKIKGLNQNRKIKRFAAFCLVVCMLFSACGKKEEAPKEEAKTYTFTEVRGIMAGLSGQGKKAEAKALLEKFGAKRLSDVKEEDYAALVHEAQVIANA